MNLRFKLALIASLFTFVGLALGLGLTYWILLNLRLNELDTESRLLAEVILETAMSRSDDQVSIPSVVENYLTDERGVNSAQVYLDGQLLWEGGIVSAPQPLDPEGLLGEKSEGRSVSSWRVFTLFEPEEGLIVQVGRHLLSTWEVLRPYNRIAIPLTFFLTMLVGTLAWPTVGVALRPLRRLTDAASRFEDAADVPEVSGSGEPVQLARSFAELLTRLRSERKREQQFLAYAAHELRTPLSALRAGLEAARSNKIPADSDMLDRLYRESLRLEALAQNLLALSRAEAGESRTAAIELSNIAATAYDRFQPLALTKGLELYLDNKPAAAWGDEQLIEQALNNLLANALRCTAHGTVTIRSGQMNDQIFLQVSDTGPGLPDPIPEGLGLRVVRAVVKTHSGKLELSSKAGTCATVWLTQRGKP